MRLLNLWSMRPGTPPELGFDVPKEEKDKPLPEIQEADEIPDYDRHIATKVSIPKDGHNFATGRVVKRSRDENGELIGKSHSNPLLDTAMYEVEFEDGAVERCHANIIAENICAQIDSEGYTKALLEEIIDHKAHETAITVSQGTTLSGKPKTTTRGWTLLLRWKD